MSYKNIFYTESTKCPNCGKIIKWDSVETGNIFIKIKYHQDTDKNCIRESKLKDILGDEVKSNLNLTFLDNEVKS